MIGQLALHVTSVLAAGPINNPNPSSPVSSAGVNLLLGYAKWGSLIACARGGAGQRRAHGVRAPVEPAGRGGQGQARPAVVPGRRGRGRARHPHPQHHLRRRLLTAPGSAAAVDRGARPLHPARDSPAERKYDTVYPGQPRPRRRWLRWFLVYVGGVLALAVIGLVIEAAVDPAQAAAALQPVRPGLPWRQAPVLRHAEPFAEARLGQAAPLSGPLQVVTGQRAGQRRVPRLPAQHRRRGLGRGLRGERGLLDARPRPRRRRHAPDRRPVVRGRAAAGRPGRGQRPPGPSASPRPGPVPGGYSLLVQPEEYQARDVTRTRRRSCCCATSRPRSPAPERRPGSPSSPSR